MVALVVVAAAVISVGAVVHQCAQQAVNQGVLVAQVPATYCAMVALVIAQGCAVTVVSLTVGLLV